MLDGLSAEIVWIVPFRTEVWVTMSPPENISKRSRLPAISWSKLKKIVSFESIDLVFEVDDILARQKSEMSHLAFVKTWKACLRMCLTLVSLSLTFKMTS